MDSPLLEDAGQWLVQLEREHGGTYAFTPNAVGGNVGAAGAAGAATTALEEEAGGCSACEGPFVGSESAV